MVKEDNITLKTNKMKKNELKSNKKVKSSDGSLNDIISTIKDKQEEFTQMLSDYTSFNNKTLIDVVETHDSIIIKADLPRLKKEDVEIAISEESVNICAEFEEEDVDKEMKYIQRERSYGKIRRSIALPSKVKIKEAEGTFKDSVLTIKLPKLVKETLKLKIQ